MIKNKNIHRKVLSIRVYGFEFSCICRHMRAERPIRVSRSVEVNNKRVFFFILF